MENNIITISREFGSGGRTIAKKVAEKLGYTYYDKEIIEKVAESTGYTPEYIAEAGEYSPTGNIFSYAFVGRDQSGVSAADYLWIAQQKLILSIAERESCVIVGRCADYILRDMEHVWNIFIHAPMAINFHILQVPASVPDNGCLLSKIECWYHFQMLFST